ncbi:MAG: polyphosphate kinase 1 [Acidimicrobiales bacterium]
MGYVTAQTDLEFVDTRPATGLTDGARKPPESFGPDRFFNRELSWLDFASRVLELAEEDNAPLLSRARFLAIFSSGLDEFFQVRVAGLKDQLAVGVREAFPDGRTVLETFAEVRERVGVLVERHSRIFRDEVRPRLAQAGVVVADYADLSGEDLGALRQVFDEQIFPVLTPLAVDPGHPFPYISSLSLNLAVTIEDPERGESRFARIKVPTRPVLPRFVQLAGADRLVPIEQVIAANLTDLFPGMRIGSCFTFRVTRNADLDLDDSEDEDLLEAVEVELRRRRFGRAVRLEVTTDMTPDVLSFLLSELELDERDVYRIPTMLDLSDLWTISAIDRPDLSEPAFTPRTPARLTRPTGEPADLFGVIRERDVLVHHPYDSFASSVEAFISQAAVDPDVLAIKQTLYRTSGEASFVSALASAAEQGKQVVALVELKARFDEKRNINWARRLEEAGVHVIYGVVGLKTHSKTALVVRREDDGIRRYCHIGTGNYNSETARIYEDLGLLSCDETLGVDLTNLFNHLTGFSREVETSSLILSPAGFRPWVLSAIARERDAGVNGRICIKVNGLTDPQVIDALYEASQAGCRIDLLVRGVCGLRPQMPGLSDNITVKSIVGEYLEHSRIFRFGVPGRDVLAKTVVRRNEPPKTMGNKATYFIGSADLMERNLDHRIEAVVPLRDADLCARLEDILALDLSDDTSSWDLDPDGSWERVRTIRGIHAQRRFEELARERSRRRRGTDGAA